MSTPYGGDERQGGEAAPPPPPPPPPSFGGGFTESPPPPGSVDYSQVQPNYGQPYGGGPAPQLAGFWIRFLGSFVDGIILSLVASVIVVFVDGGFQARNTITAVLGGAYFIYFHGSSGQTLGQRLTGIKVVDQANGATIDYGRAAIRWLVSYVSAFVILLGYLWMLWDPRNQTWHDMAARTLVIKVPR